MNKAEIAEELGLTKAARRLDNTAYVHVNDVFVDRGGDNGIEFSLESRETFVLLEISSVCDDYNLEIDELEGDVPEEVTAISQASVDVTPI